MITKEDWLPVGSVVRLKDGERPIAVAGYMAIDGNTGRYWDYVGYPYPQGRIAPRDYFFDKEMIDEIYLVGYMDQAECLFLSFLDSQDEAYQAKKSEAVSEKPGDGTGAVVASPSEE